MTPKTHPLRGYQSWDCLSTARHYAHYLVDNGRADRVYIGKRPRGGAAGGYWYQLTLTETKDTVECVAPQASEPDSYTITDYDAAVDQHGGMHQPRGLCVEAMLMVATRRGWRDLQVGFVNGDMDAAQLAQALVERLELLGSENEWAKMWAAACEAERQGTRY